jgi:WD40 repeat protein
MAWIVAEDSRESVVVAAIPGKTMSLPAVTQETQAIRPCHKFEGHTHDVDGVIHLPGGQRMMTASWDGSLRVWNLHTGKQIGNDWRDGESGVDTISLSLDGKKVASGGDDGAVRSWDVDTGEVIAKWVGHTSVVHCVCWSQDGGRVVSGSDDGTARVWDVESGKTVLTIETGLTEVHAVIYSPDTTMIATGGISSEREYLKIWDAKTSKLLANLKGHTATVWCLAWTANGQTLISGSWDYSVRTWNTTTWQQISVLRGHTSNIIGIAISVNGRILASASADKTARLWNLENGQPIGSPLQRADLVRCTSFSTDGKLLATGCNDKNAYLWDISAIVKEAGLGELLFVNPNVSRPFLISLYQLNALSQEKSAVCDAFIHPHRV